MFLYGLIYANNHGDYISSVLLAESHFDAERKALEDVKKWDGFHVYSVNFLDKSKLDASEIVFVGA